MPRSWVRPVTPRNEVLEGAPPLVCKGGLLRPDPSFRLSFSLLLFGCPSHGVRASVFDLFFLVLPSRPEQPDFSCVPQFGASGRGVERIAARTQQSSTIPWSTVNAPVRLPRRTVNSTTRRLNLSSPKRSTGAAKQVSPARKAGFKRHYNPKRRRRGAATICASSSRYVCPMCTSSSRFIDKTPAPRLL